MSLRQRSRRNLVRLERRLRTRRYVASGADVSPTAQIARGTRLTPRTRIAHNVWINGAATLRGSGSIDVGEHTAIGEQLLVVTTNHATNHATMLLRTHWDNDFTDLESSGDVVIAPACWIGDRVTLLAGVHLGIGTVVAAGAVVPKGHYPPYSVLGGVPARVLRQRAGDETVAALLDSRWWTWDDDRVARNRAFFEADLDTVTAAELRAFIAE